MGGFDARLGRAFTFEPADLEANRRGEMSRDQQVMFANAVRLGRRRERRMLPVFGVLLLAALVAAVVGSGADPAAVAVAVAMVVFLVVLVAAFRRRDVARRRSMAAGAVEAVEGPWQLDSSLDGTWRVRVGGRLVAADRLAVESLVDGGVYRFYVLPDAGVAAALSVERIG
jgi:hypothetical protein